MASLQHIGIIPDGTRRWAKERGVPLEDAYTKALGLLLSHVSEAFACGASAASLFLLSTHNLRRSPRDLEPYLAAGELFLSEVLPAACKAMSARPILAGRRELLPTALGEPFDKLADLECDWERELYLCAAYDPWSELNMAMELWSERRENRSLIEYLWVPKKLDLVVRTGGAVTLSDFLPLQAGYAQLILLPELFNDLSPTRFKRILSDHKGKNLKVGV